MTELNDAGRGLGSLVGGHLIVSLGLPAAFRSYSAIALGAGFLYIVFHFGYFKRKLAARGKLSLEKI